LAEVHRAGLTLRAVWDGYRAGTRAETAPGLKKLGEAIKEVIEAKRLANRRPCYVAELSRYLSCFAKGRESMEVGVFTSEHIEKWFVSRKDSPHTRATGINRLSALFDFCWRKKWIADNPCLRMEKVHLEYGVPKIFPVQECEALLRAAEEQDRELIPRLVLMLFAGVRREEVSRLSWADVDLDRGFLKIDAAASKVRHRRLVLLHPTAIAWLKLGGELPCNSNLRRRLDSVRKAAALTAWPHDVLRHTAASHLVVLHGTTKTADMLGHSESILHRHYRELVKPTDNERFWLLLPKLTTPIAKSADAESQHARRSARL